MYPGATLGRLGAVPPARDGGMEVVLGIGRLVQLEGAVGRHGYGMNLGVKAGRVRWQWSRGAEEQRRSRRLRTSDEKRGR